MIDPKEFNFVSQLSHFGWGLAIVLVGARFGHGCEFVLAGTWVAYAAVKEFWYDKWYETAEVRGSSVEDFIYQVAGAGVGLAFVLLTK